MCGVSLFSDEGKIWDCKQRGGALLQARGLGLRGQGVNALLWVPYSPAGGDACAPGMTCHSRTHCKMSSDEVTNKMPTVLKSRGHMSPAGHSPSACLGAAFLPHQLRAGVSALPRAPMLIRACADTAHSSFHPATPGTAVLGKMGTAAFKQSICLFLKQLVTAVRSWTRYWAQNNYDKNKFQMGSKGVVFVFTELEWIPCLQVPLVFMDRKHELHTIIYYKQKRWMLQQPIYLCSCAFLRFMYCLTHGES